MKRMSRALAIVAVALVALLTTPSLAGAHGSVTVGDMTLGVGWRDEPTFADQPNAVELTAVDSAGVQVVDPDSALSATVTFGDATVVRPMVFVGPGDYVAPLVPTQAGTYSFHIEGTLAGETVDFEATCSDTTFDCVAAADEVEFPPRSAGASPAASSSSPSGSDSASNPLGIVALGVSMVALTAVVVLVLRSRRPE
jgi:hypothetical protein